MKRLSLPIKNQLIPNFKNRIKGMFFIL